MLALAMTYSTGMSAGLTEYGIFMNILVVGAWLDQYLNSRFLSYLIVILSLIFSSSLVLKKYESPYSWWGYNLPSIYEATQLSKQGLTERLHFSPDEYNEFTDIQTRLRNLPCGGEIISYPHIPLFLLDQKALPGGQAAMYWYDFVSNKTLTKEANRFESAQIAAVVEKILPGVERSHEELFGTENGQVRTKLLGMLLNKTNDFEAIDYENLGIRALYCLK
jgi:hypothetical protein